MNALPNDPKACDAFRPGASRFERIFLSLWTADSPRAYRIGLAVAALAGATIAAMLLFRGAGHQRSMPWDAAEFLDACWRMYCGQRPHTDFSNPLGPDPYWIVVLGMKISGPTADAMATGPVLALPLMLMWAWVLGKTRLSAFATAIFAVFTVLLFVGIQPLGGEFRSPSYAMCYNRMGWAWFDLLALECLLPPRRPGARADFAGGFSTGCAAALLIFTKLNYAVGAALVIGAGLLCYRFAARRWLGLVAGGLSVVVLNVVGLHLNLADFLREQLRLLAGGGPGGLLFSIAQAVCTSVHELLLVLLAMVFAWPEIVPAAPEPSWHCRYAPVLASLAAIAAGLFIVSANAQTGFIPAFALAALLVPEQLGRRATGGGEWRVRLCLAAFACLALVGPLVCTDAAGIVYGAVWQARRAPGLDESSRVNTPSLRMLLLPRWPGETDRAQALANLRAGIFTPFTYGVWVSDGLDLLRRHGLASARVLCFDYFNPFPFALQAPAPKGDIICWHFGRLVSERTAPRSETLFADADAVLVPKVMFHPGFVAIKQRLYGATLARDFVPVGESACWFLLERRR